MNIGEEYTVKIEKLLNEGRSFARLENTPVFINGGCPEDVVKIKISKINKTFITADIIEIIEKSKYRIKPFCPLHNVCGSCNWQYIDYGEQLNQKRKIVQETLEKIAGVKINVNNVIESPYKKGYRCKIQLPVSQTKVSKRLLSGYYKKNSHELINIKNCPMQPEIINEINEFIKLEASKLNISAYNEKRNTGLIRHIIYRVASNSEEILVIFVINSQFITKQLKELSEILINKYFQIKGVCVNYNTKKTNVIMGENTVSLTGKNYYIENLNGIKYKISANSFFQVNPLCAVKIFETVKGLILSRIKNPAILDAYSGVSSFGVWLSSAASKVVCIEEAKSASNDAKENIKLNKIKNIEIINGDAGLEFKKLLDSKIRFDVSVIDPPRKGCSQEALFALKELTLKYIVYVSCNPATLARDMKFLKLNGFNPVYVQPFDMFPHTYHIETVVLFNKS